MSLLAGIAAWSEFAFGLLLLAVQVLAHESGFWLGRRRTERGAAQPESVGVVVGAMLALLAFVLALTLTFANTRFVERRAGTLAEANAISTAWLRAHAVGEPQAVEIARLLESYTNLRRAYVRAGTNRGEIDEIERGTSALQAKIWGHMAEIARERRDPMAVSLMAALNETFDMTATVRFAHELRLPAALFWGLISMLVLGMGALGYQMGLRKSRTHAVAGVLAVMWTAVIVGILDLSTARIGRIRTSAVVYDWTLEGFQNAIETPPLSENR
jgi:hypothetical protein